MKKKDNQILKILDRYWFYGKIGSSYVTRCPFCKTEDKEKKHNAQINLESETIHCYTESKTYSLKDIKAHFGETKKEEKETPGEVYVGIIDDVIESPLISGEKTHTAKKEKTEADIIASMTANGYKLVRKFEFFDLNKKKLYDKLRFEDAEGKKEIVLCKDGMAGLKGTKQTLYGLNRIDKVEKDGTVYIIEDEEDVLTIPCEKIFLTEGEKCKEALEKEVSRDILVLSFCKPSDFEGLEKIFKDKEVVIFEDNDDTGRKNTEEVISILKPFAKVISVVGFPDRDKGYDVADFIRDHRGSLESYMETNIRVVYKDPLMQVDCDVVTDIENTKDFILEPFIPSRAICIFDGLGETGKSLIATQLAFCIAYGLPFLDVENNEGPRKVLYITAEDTRKTFNDRCMLIKRGLGIENKRLETLYWISALSDRFMCKTRVMLMRHAGNFMGTEFYDFLKTLIQKLNPCLVVLDSLINFYGLDENSSEHASIFMDALKTLTVRQKEDISFLLLHHQTKEAMRNDGEKIFRGSSVFREQSRCRFFIQKESDNTKKIVIEKLNAHTDCEREYRVMLS
ncbi:MAG: AAA family ATPase, partial [Candidatus Aenigmatarchaeota archaeon]